MPAALAGGVQGLCMDTARRVTFALCVGFSEGVEDVGHEDQSSVRRRGSSTPAARLSCMKVMGPGMPSATRPCDS